MSKIGRKAIDIRGITVEINGQEIRYKGPKSSGLYVLPEEIQAHIADNKLILFAKDKEKISREINRVWGLHRALLANKIKGAATEFEKKLEINGLGFKAALSGKKLILTLGFSHKIDFDLPNNLTVEIDKLGQKLTLKSSDKDLVGQIASLIKSKRLPEPYKGTGIKLASEKLIRKAGKTKASA
jgi:large subunit ribosomal protein L6